MASLKAAVNFTDSEMYFKSGLRLKLQGILNLKQHVKSIHKHT